MVGTDANDLPGLDTKLRALPVTEADHIARCLRYDNDSPQFDLQPGKAHILHFEKIDGFKDEPGFNAAHSAFIAMAEGKGWSIVTTDRGDAFTPENLSHFDAVIWNNISEDVLTPSMGNHTIARSRHVGKGQMFYSAIGHLPQSYSEPRYVVLLEGAADRAIDKSASPTTVHE